MKTAEEKANELYPNTKTSPFENQFRVAERKAFIKGVKYGKRQQVNSVDLADVVGRSEQLAEHKCKFYVNADWTYLRCECGQRLEPKG
jgi:uncharacterized protein YnzC (UPF0291/DUF896 family)